MRKIKDKDFKLPSLDGLNQNKSRIGETEMDDNYNFVQGNKKKNDGNGGGNDEYYKKKIEEMKRELDTKSGAIMALQRNFESLSTMLKNEKQESMKSRMEHEDLKQRYESIYQENLKMKKTVEQTQKLQEDLQLLQVKYQNKDEAYNIVKLEKNQISKQVLELEKSQALLQAEVNTLQENNQNLQKELNLYRDIQKFVQELENQIQSLKDQIVKKDQDYLRLLQLTDNQKNMIQTIEIEKSQLIKEIEALKTKQKNLNDLETQYLRQLQDKQNEMLGLKEQMKKLEGFGENEKLRAELKEQQASELRGAVNQKMKELEQLLGSLQQMENQIKGCRCKKYEDLISKYEDLLTQCSEVELLPKFELETLRNMANSLRESLQIMTSELERQNIKFQKQEKDKQSEKESFRQKINELERQMDILNEEKASLLSSLSNFNQEQVSQKGQIDAQLQKKNYQIGQLTKENSDLIAKNETLKNENQRIQNNYEQLTEIHIQLKERVQSMEISLKDLKEMRDLGEQKYGQEVQQLRKRLESEVENALVLQTAHRKVSQIMKDKEQEFETQKSQFIIQIKDLNQEILNNSENIRRMTSIVDEKNQTIEEQKRKYSELQRVMDDQEIICVGQTNQIKEQKIKIQTNETDIFKLNLEIKNLKKSIGELQDQIQALDPEKVKKEQKENEQKKKIIASTIAKIINAQEAAMTNLLCTMCLETLEQTVTVSPCGHHFCQKCKKGYEKQCVQCKGNQMNYSYFNNSSMDGVVSKISFIKIQLESINL